MPMRREESGSETHTIAGIELPRRLTRSELEAMADVSEIPPHMIKPLIAYVVNHRATGHFLMAIMENRLKEACNRADDDNKTKIWNYAYFLTNYAPAMCWGDNKAYEKWLALGREARDRERAEAKREV